MKHSYTKKFAAFLGLSFAFMLFGISGNYFSADILFTNKAKQVSDNSNVNLDTAFDLWYIKNEAGIQDWKVPSAGGVIDLPMGITHNGNQPDDLGVVPIDSVEFQLVGVPDFLEWVETSTYEGFHVDTLITPNENDATTNDISLFVAPEAYSGPGADVTTNIPNDEIGDLILGASEILRANFKVVKDVPEAPSPYLSFSIKAILAARDGDFTRYEIGGRIGNIGTVNIIGLETGPPQIVTTTGTSQKSVLLEFNVQVLQGGGSNGSERPSNYLIYKCGPNVPAPVSDDPNADDARSCRNMTQGSILDPSEPLTAVRKSDDLHLVELTNRDQHIFQDSAYYIVLVSNVADETGRVENAMPVEGVFSQMFQWNPHPFVANISATSPNQVRLVFSENVCPAASNQIRSAGNVNNYELFTCNIDDTSIDECIKKNDPGVENLDITGIDFDGLQTVLLDTTTQVPDAWYIARVRNVANAECDSTTAIPDDPDPAYYTNQFQGYTEQGAELLIGISNASQLNLPWREKMYLTPTGGTAPYSWSVIPEDAGTFDFSDPNYVIFKPTLKDNSNQAIHDERDVIIRITDIVGDTYDVPVHILRRGDVGGEGIRFLDKTDTMDLNDVSAGWRR